ncbi:hypothetical protein B0H67DRAFT_10019 [Lasiosphaeris hirsuta]|uniref:Uncharacterized protein n=1 Tax=Lasiosphaeris hirsuta TaxID=260670 RepID=A0AA40B8Z4_9PEZI|nr:hypothetical protein B0H67DRAFT_10019 [Lasiosphaeris hirsuta]
MDRMGSDRPSTVRMACEMGLPAKRSQHSQSRAPSIEHRSSMEQRHGSIHLPPLHPSEDAPPRAATALSLKPHCRPPDIPQPLAKYREISPPFISASLSKIERPHRLLDRLELAHVTNSAPAEAATSLRATI